jgi:anti-repressor protein
MTELIKIETNENGQQAVSGRELHEFLEVGRDFTTWMKQMIGYGFGEHSDYETCSPNMGSEIHGGQNKVDYVMTLDMAKEISMLQRTEKGKQARQYFISCEKELKALTPSLPNFANPVEAARAWADATEAKQLAEEKTKQLEAKIKQDEDKVEFASTVQASDTCIDMGDVAKILNIDGFGRNKIFDILRKNNIMNKKNIPYAEYVKRGYFKMSEYPLENPKCPGEYWAIKKVQVTQKGLDYIRKLFY